MENINDTRCYSRNKFENSRKKTMWQKLQYDINLSDVTLVCEYKEIKAHKIVISSCSSVIKSILKQSPAQNPCLYFSGIKFQELENLVNYMYQGEVNISKEKINSFLDIAQYLKTKGIPEENMETSRNLDLYRTEFCFSKESKTDFLFDTKNIDLANYDYTKNIDFASYDDTKNIDLANDYEDNHQINSGSSKCDVNNEKRSMEYSEQIKRVFYQCYQCDYKTTEEANFFEHRKLKHDAQREFNANSLENDKIDINLLIKLKQKYLHMQKKAQENIKIFSCDLCEKQYSHYAGLHEHKLTIHKGVRYPCKHCVYKGTTKDALKRHIQSIHEGVRYSCTLCNLKATTKSSLVYHKRVVHDKVPFQCDKCDYKVTSKRSLARHKMRDHDGDKFLCEQCNYMTMDKGQLKRHVMSIHIGIRHHCDQCDFQTTHRKNLKRHAHSFHKKY